MEVPRLCKIIVVPKAPFNLIINVKLAMEIICGQKFTVGGYHVDDYR